MKESTKEKLRQRVVSEETREKLRSVEYTQERSGKLRARIRKQCLAVVGTDGDGNQLHFDAIRHVASAGFDLRAVHRCLKGKSKHHRGYRWEYR